MQDMQFPPSDIKFWVICAALYYISGQNHKLQCEICSFHPQLLNFGSFVQRGTIFWVKIASCNAISKFPLPDLIFWVIFAEQYYILGQNSKLQCYIEVSTPRPHILGHLCGAVLYFGSKLLFAKRYWSFHFKTSYFGSSLRRSTIFLVNIATCNTTSRFPLPDLIFQVKITECNTKSYFQTCEQKLE
jgi:hypothetical protein